ncbi:unnamed protein product [Gordionus sp. m RMFG-2023]
MQINTDLNDIFRTDKYRHGSRNRPLSFLALVLEGTPHLISNSFRNIIKRIDLQDPNSYLIPHNRDVPLMLPNYPILVNF